MKIHLITILTLPFVLNQAVIQQPSCMSQLICAHRGTLKDSQLENSVPNIMQTFATGVDMVEVDLAESRNGTIYLLHDRTLDRTTTGRGLMRKVSDTQISRLTLVDPMSRKTTPEHISSFESLLKEAPKDVHVLVDLKDVPPIDAVRLIRKYDMINAVILLTFNSRVAKAAYDSDPRILVSVLVTTVPSLKASLLAAHGHPTAVYVAQDAPSEVFAAARAAGKLIISDSLGNLDDRILSQFNSDKYCPSSATSNWTLADVLVTNHALALSHKGRCLCT